MKIYVDQIPNKFQNHRRAMIYQQILKDFNCTPVRDTPDSIEFELSPDADQRSVFQMLEALSPEGVELSPSDIPAMVNHDRHRAAIVRRAMDEGLVRREFVVDEYNEMLSDWDRGIWNYDFTPEAYEEINAATELKPEDYQL